MPISVPIKAIKLTPGSAITIHELSWQDFEGIVTELGEHRHLRIAYYGGTLEIMSPLARHERPHRIIADIIKTILNLQERDWEDFGSTTFKLPEIAGVEPDTCLYIQNANLVRGCTDMDLTIYPPPDIAIESDVTSKTTLDAYLALKIPEVWIYSNDQLKIYLFDGTNYLERDSSPILPTLSLKTLIPQLVKRAIERGTSSMLRQLRNTMDLS